MKNKIFKRYAMYKEYGENYGSICRNCCNFCQYEFDGRRYNKCIAYGVDKTNDTTWNGSWTGCGMYNMPQDRTLMSLAVRKKLITLDNF